MKTENKLIPIKVIAAMDADKSATGNLEIKSLSQANRLFLALKFLALCWLLAVLFVFVPILHFFLVPAAFFAGIFIFKKKYELEEYLEKGNFVCPKCDSEVTLSKGPFNWPKRTECTFCHEKVLLEKLD